MSGFLTEWVVQTSEADHVLRITYGPGEQSVMHHHPDHVAVALGD